MPNLLQLEIQCPFLFQHPKMIEHAILDPKWKKRNEKSKGLKGVTHERNYLPTRVLLLGVH